MPRSANKPLTLQEQVLELAKTVAAQQRTIDSLLRPKPRTHWRQIEFARTIADPDAVPTYPDAETHDYPIRFVDMEESAGTNRSAGLQAYAHAPIAVLVPEGSLIIVKQTRKGRWAMISIVPADGCNPFLGWINAGGVPEDGSPAYALTLSAAGCLRKTPIGDCGEE